MKFATFTQRVTTMTTPNPGVLSALSSNKFSKLKPLSAKTLTQRGSRRIPGVLFKKVSGKIYMSVPDVFLVGNARAESAQEAFVLASLRMNNAKRENVGLGLNAARNRMEKSVREFVRMSNSLEVNVG